MEIKIYWLRWPRDGANRVGCGSGSHLYRLTQWSWKNVRSRWVGYKNLRIASEILTSDGRPPLNRGSGTKRLVSRVGGCLCGDSFPRENVPVGCAAPSCTLPINGRNVTAPESFGKISAPMRIVFRYVLILITSLCRFDRLRVQVTKLDNFLQHRIHTRLWALPRRLVTASHASYKNQIFGRESTSFKSPLNSCRTFLERWNSSPFLHSLPWLPLHLQGLYPRHLQLP